MDAALQDVLLTYGAEGYGCYWYCVELIAGTITKDKLTFELEHDARIVARNLNLSAQKVEEMMKHFVDLGLFQFNPNSNRVLCLTLAKRLDDSVRKGAHVEEIVNKINESGLVGKIPNYSGKVPLEVEEEIEEEKNIRDLRKHIFGLWKKHYPNHTQPLDKAWENSERDRNFKSRLSEDERFLENGFWEWYFSRIAQHNYYGANTSHNWKPKLEWFFQRKNFYNCLEIVNAQT